VTSVQCTVLKHEADGICKVSVMDNHSAGSHQPCDWLRTACLLICQTQITMCQQGEIVNTSKQHCSPVFLVSGIPKLCQNSNGIVPTGASNEVGLS